MKKFLFFVAIVLLAATCIKAKPINAERTTVEKGMLPKVYSKCYDGYLNVRTQPTSKSRIVGRFSNGNTVSCSVDGEVMNYIIISFDNFTTNSSNPEFRNNIIQFDVICHFDEWHLKDY